MPVINFTAQLRGTIGKERDFVVFKALPGRVLDAAITDVKNLEPITAQNPRVTPVGDAVKVQARFSGVSGRPFNTRISISAVIELALARTALLVATGAETTGVQPVETVEVEAVVGERPLEPAGAETACKQPQESAP